MPDTEEFSTADVKTTSINMLLMRGFRLLPIHHDTKVAALPGWPEAATNDAAAAHRLFQLDRESCYFNIGVATGSFASGKHFFVLDVDSRPNASGHATLMAMLDRTGEHVPPTWVSDTPSGGYHIWFHSPFPVRCSTSAIGKGLDIKGVGGYVLAPGSDIGGKPYRWRPDRHPDHTPLADAPEWLLSAVIASESLHDLTAQAPAIDDDEADNPEWVQRYREYLSTAPVAVEGQGGDHRTYCVAAAGRDRGLTEAVTYAEMLAWNKRCLPPWAPGALATKVANAYAYAVRPFGVTVASHEPDFPVLDGGPVAEDIFDQPTQGQRPSRQGCCAPRPQYLELGDEATYPRRQWLYERCYLRKYLSVVVAPGGVGKSAMILLDAVAMATGRALRGHQVVGSRHGGGHKVWLHNGEDPGEEVKRRLFAVLRCHGVAQADLAGKLLVTNGRDHRLCIATQDRDGVAVSPKVVDQLVADLVAEQVDVLVVDTLATAHTCSENDNGAMEMVARAWADIADRAECSVVLIHHTRKLGSGGEATAESARGASSLVAAARSVQVLQKMSAEEAAQAGVPEEDRRNYVKVVDDKNNLAVHLGVGEWLKLESIDLANGERVGAASPWVWPTANEMIGLAADEEEKIHKEMVGLEYRTDPRSTEWIGFDLANRMHLDPDVAANRKRISALIGAWEKAGRVERINIMDNRRREKPGFRVV